MSGSTPPCDDLSLPHGLRHARLYPCGWLCDRHSPSARQGRPEPQPGPGWPAGSYLNQIEPEPPVEQEQS